MARLVGKIKTRIEVTRLSRNFFSLVTPLGDSRMPTVAAMFAIFFVD